MDSSPRRAGVVILKDRKILLMHRIRNGEEYYVLPGGHVEAGEDSKSAAKREAKEETSLDIEIGELFISFSPQNRQGHDYFLAKSFSGELQLSGEEAERNSIHNHYSLEWTDLTRLPDLDLYPTEAKESLIKTYLQS